jgi:hypothetical protein
MGKTRSEKSSAGASDGADASGPGLPPAGEPAEPLERARLQAEVARQRVRIAKEELKRARRRVKEAKREAKRARKQAAAARKVWKKARKAHRAGTAHQPPARRARGPQPLEGSARGAKRKSKRRRAPGGEPEARMDGSAPVTKSPET